MPFPMLILFLLGIVRSSLQNELDNFFKKVFGSEIAIVFMTKAAFTKARKKLKYQAFIELGKVMLNYFYEHFPTKRWKGFFLKSVDGTQLYLLKNKEIEEHFGKIFGKNGEEYIMANVSQIFDSLNGVTTSALICRCDIGERELLEMQIASLTKEDLLLLDRGYPAFWLFALLMSKKINFCARIDSLTWNVVKQFNKSKEKEKIVVFYPSVPAKKQCISKGISTEPLTLRLVKVELESGQTEILVTTLNDMRKYKHQIFKDLYHYRWPVEEDFKTMKHRIEIENFSGKSVESIYQDFYAKIFTKNLTSILKEEAQDQVDEMCKENQRKEKYKVNFTNALSKMKDTIVLLFTRENIVELLEQLLNLFAKVIEAVRPNRERNQRHKHPPKRFYPQYKGIA